MHKRLNKTITNLDQYSSRPTMVHDNVMHLCNGLCFVQYTILPGQEGRTQKQEKPLNLNCYC